MLPPEPILRAALRWLEKLPRSGVRRCRALFTTHPEYSDITPTQYDAAYSWLDDVGLLGNGDRHAPTRQQVFDAVILYVPWFQDADLLIQAPEELPEDALRLADTLGIDAHRAFQYIKSLWRKVDLEQRARIGSAGERALVDLLKGSLAARVDHVSQYSDSYGYDIDIRKGAYRLHLEVKSTLRRHRLVVFLSRHEFETLSHDPSWQLVAVRLSGDLKAEAVCSVPSPWIREHVPRDISSNGHWESCRLSIPLDQIRHGIPRLSPLLNGNYSPLIDGSTDW